MGLKIILSCSRYPFFWQSVYNTFYLIILGVPLSTIVGLGTAPLLNQKLRGTGLYRTLIYLPSVVPPVAVALLWTWILNPYNGLLNNILKIFRISGPGWLSDPHWSKLAVLIMVIWGIGNVMVLYLAALQEVSQELYEAGVIDGANKFQLFWYITLPGISPVIFYNVVTGIINFSQFFTQAYVVNSASTSTTASATTGAPSHSLLFFATYIYLNGFTYLKMGYASALAWILLVFTLSGTWLLFKTSGSLYKTK